jgi:hypothetical protein
VRAQPLLFFSGGFAVCRGRSESRKQTLPTLSENHFDEMKKSSQWFSKMIGMIFQNYSGCADMSFKRPERAMQAKD